MNKNNFRFRSSGDFKNKYSTLTGFVFKTRPNSVFISKSDNTWIHYGNPKSYLYTCNSLRSCQNKDISFNTLPSNHLYFAAIHIESPNSSEKFEIHDNYKNFNNVYGYRCISDKITLKYTESFKAWKATKYSNILVAKSIFAHNEYYHNFHYGSQTKRFFVPRSNSGKGNVYILRNTSQYSHFSASYVFSQNGKDIEVTYKKEGFINWSGTLTPIITAQRKTNSNYQNANSFDFGTQFTFNGKMFRNAALFYVKFDFGNRIFNGFDDDVALIKYVGNPCEGEKTTNIQKTVTYSKWMGNLRVALIVEFAHSYEKLKVSAGSSSTELDIFRNSTAAQNLVLDRGSFYGVKGQFSSFYLAIRDSEGFFIKGSPTFKHKMKNQTTETTVNLVETNEIQRADGNTLTACYKFSQIYASEGLYQASFRLDSINMTEKFAVVLNNTGCNARSFFDLDTNSCSSTCNKIREGSLCYKYCDRGCIETDLTACPGDFKFVQNASRCVAECAATELINDGKECVNSCPSGKFKIGRECKDGCTVLEEDGVCVNSCSQGKYILDGKCVDNCIGTKYLIDTGVCVSSCGSNKIITNGNICTVNCTTPTLYLQDGNCIAQCTSNYFLKGSNCVSDCGTGFYKDNSTMRCVQSCPNFHDGDHCASNCNDKLKQGDYCVSTCSLGFLLEGDSCVSQCSSSNVKQNNKCQSYCDSSFKNQDGICVSTCSASKLEEAGPQEAKCVNNCSSANSFVENNKCVRECDSTNIVDTPSICRPSESNCVEEFSSRMRECLEECPPNLKKQLRAGEQRGVCVKECSVDFVLRKNGECHETCEGTEVIQNGECEDECADRLVEDSGKCVFKCSSSNPYVENKKCVSECSSGGKVENGECVADCSEALFEEPDSNNQIHCVRACRPDLYRILSDKKCVSTCSKQPDSTDSNNPFLYSDENRNCVKDCPVGIYSGVCTDSCCAVNDCTNPFIGRDKTCLPDCPEGEFILEGRCLEECPERMLVFEGRTCVRSCPEFKIGVNCIEKCDGFTVPNPNADEGECVESCPPTLPFYYPEDKICINECPFYNGKGMECLNICSEFIDVVGKRLNCRGKCTDPKHFSKQTERTICATKSEETLLKIKVKQSEYNISQNCIDLLKNPSELTDKQCKTKCRDTEAFAVKLTENECVNECPRDQPYFYNNICEESCPMYYTLHNECLTDCQSDTPLSQKIEDKEYCLFECQDGWLPSRNNVCYDPAEIQCEKPKVQVEDNCESCDFGFVYEEGKCAEKCSSCFELSSQGICEKCNGVKFRGKCELICPLGYSPDPEGPACAPECKSCSDLKMLESNGKCVAECPSRQFERNGKCTSCSEVSSFENAEEEQICGSCKEKFKTEDGSCIEQCNMHSFTKEGEHFCIGCLGAFFYKDTCVAKCPDDTVTYYHKRECLPLPQNCTTDAHLCKRESTCITGVNGPKCVCRSNTKGLLCQVLVDQVEEENDIQKVKSWNNTAELQPTVLVNAMKLVGGKIEEPELLDSVDKLAKEAFVEAKRENFFVLADFSLKETPFEDKTKAKNRRKDMIEEIKEISTPSSRRLLQVDDKYFEYDGENYSVVYTKELGNRANLDECLAKLREQLNMPQATFEYQYIQLNGSLALDAPEVTNSQLQLNSEPFVTVSIYVDNQPQDISKACSLESVDVQYEVPPKADTDLLEKMQGKGVNPFDQTDEFFTHICSLSNSGSDITLSKRKKDNFVDPAEECNQKEGQICTITEFTAEEVKCSCIGLNNNPPSLNESFLTTFTESNFRLVKCYNKAFTRKILSNPGFVLSFSVFIVFYILQNLSLIYTIRRLRGSHFKTFLSNSMLILGQKEVVFEEYFKENNKSSIQIQPSISIISPKKQERSADVSSIRELEEDSKQELKAEQKVKLEADLKQLGPTVMDYDSLSLEEQIEWDKRSIWRIFKVQAMRNHSYLNAFSFDFLLVPMHIRLFFLMTIILVAMSLNAFFYTEALIDSRAEAKDAV